ncbi:MAG: hypothetical protein AAF127_13345 [Pseudomonadota bacterium]
MSETSFASLEPKLLARKGGAKPAMRPQLAPLMASVDELEEAKLDDLGWNDMGECEAAASEASEVSNLPLHQSNDDELIVSAKPDIQADGAPTPLILAKKTPRPHPIIDPMTSADIFDITARTPRRAANEDAGAAQDEQAPREPVEPIMLRPASKTPSSTQADESASAAPLLRTKPQAREQGAAKAPKSKNSGRRAAFTLRLDTERHLKLRLAATMKGVSAQSLVTDALDALFSDIEHLDDLARRMSPE